MKRLLALVMLLLCLQVSYAATIHGAIYNSQLELQKDAKLEINTEPKQAFISKDGAYSFNVPKGDYLLTALHYDNSIVDLKAEEKISIVDEGDYTLDIIMFDAIEEDAESIDFDIGNISLDEKTNIALYITGAASFAALLFAALLFAYKRRTKKAAHSADKKEERKESKEKTKHEAKEEAEESPKDDLKKIISIISSEGGRATQLEIRKRIPLSEAKISLMIAELEDKKIIRKIKKGRGNIIILNK